MKSLRFLALVACALLAACGKPNTQEEPLAFSILSARANSPWGRCGTP